MAKFFLLTVLLYFPVSFYAQRGFPNYYKYIELASKGDSLYQINDFKNAALTYLAAANIEVEKGIGNSNTNMYYNAACAFSRDKNTEEAFTCLNYIAEENFSDYGKIAEDSDLVYLHKDKRWSTFLSKIKANEETTARKELLILERTTTSSENEEIIFYPYTDFAKQFLQDDTLCFISINYQNFRIFFTGYSFASTHLEEIKSQLSIALSRAMSILGANAYKRGINVILADSPEEMQELTGLYIHGGLACIGEDLIFFICNNNRRWQIKHELFHLVSNQVWGNTQSRLLNEGSAVYADNECYFDNPIYSITSYLISTNKALPVQSLINNFDIEAGENEVIVYIESAAIFKYLYEKYGIEKMKSLWIGGFKNFQSIYGISIEDFENEWLNYLKSIPSPDNIDIDNLLKNGCG